MLSLEFARRLQAEEYGNRDMREFEAYGAVARQGKTKTTKKAKIEADAIDLTKEEPGRPTKKTNAEADDLRKEQLDAYGEALRQDKVKTAKKVEAAKAEASKAEASKAEAAQAEAVQAEAVQVDVPSLSEMRLLRIKAFSKPTAN